MRLIRIGFETSRKLLNDLNLINVQTCQEWVNKIIENDDLCVVLEDKRGSYKRITFYEMFPDIGMEAKAYALNHALAKGCYFDVYSLAKFIDERFQEMYPELIDDDRDMEQQKLVRSVQSCRADILKWGAKFDPNTSRPYFEGHERSDVVVQRKKFIDKMLDSKDFYYIPFKN